MDMDVYRQKPLRVHSFLAGIPLRTLERVDLPGGHEGMTIEEISGVVGFGGEVEMEVGQVTQALFWLRTLIGRILGWDEAKELVKSASFISRPTRNTERRQAAVGADSDGKTAQSHGINTRPDMEAYFSIRKFRLPLNF